MRISLLVILLFPLGVYGQNRKFLDRINDLEPIHHEEFTATSDQRMDLVDFDATRFSGMIIGTFNAHRRLKYRSELVQDSLLNRIAQAGIETFSKSRFIYSREWKQEKRSIKYALHHHRAKHKVYSAHAFTLDVLDLAQSKSFYVDRKEGLSELRLYEGKFPKVTDQEDEDYVEPVPVYSITEKQFGERLLDLFDTGQYERDVLSKDYSQIGVAVKVDKRSLFSTYRPRLFVIVIFSGKKLQDIFIPNEILQGESTSVIP